MHPKLTLVALAALALAPALPASSWLSGPSTYQQAVQAAAEARWDDARQLAEAADASEGRVDWLLELLDGREQADEAGARPMAATFGHHNLYLFLRAEGVAAELVDGAYARAVQAYQGTFQREARDPGYQVPWAVEWTYLALLFEGDRMDDARAFIEARFSPGLSLEGPDPARAASLSVHQRMIAAYVHTARGDHDAALSFLKAASEDSPFYAQDWAVRSDDFAALKGDARFRALFD